MNAEERSHPEAQRQRIIGRFGAIRPLANLLGHKTSRGKNDATTAMLNLSIIGETSMKAVVVRGRSRRRGRRSMESVKNRRRERAIERLVTIYLES